MNRKYEYIIENVSLNLIFKKKKQYKRNNYYPVYLKIMSY
jgi:hypothetical protein